MKPEAFSVRSLGLVAVACAVLPATSTALELVPVSAAQCAAWCDHLLPLPKEVGFDRAVVLAPQSVRIRTLAAASDVELQAAAELVALFERKAGVAPDGAGFEVCIGTLDGAGTLEGIPIAAAGRLAELPHPRQAYTIQPEGDSRLLVAALDGPGLYHGVRTLMQLLEPKLGPDRATIPLATVVDWPDLDERGLWNFDLDLLPWLAALKLNFARLNPLPERIERDKPIRVRMRGTEQFPDLLQAARLRAINAVPTVTHLNYIGHHHGAYAAYPEAAGQGDGAVPGTWLGSRNIRLPCAASPVWITIIAQYMSAIAELGARDISVWLSEHEGQCQCAQCLEAGQLRMETRAACAGWAEARKEHPELVLRIFYCMGGKSEEDTYACLAELPPEVKIERCYGKYPNAFDRVAGEGRWLASYAGPHLAGGTHSGLRFYGGSRTREYVQRHLERKWSGIYSINYVYSKGPWQQALFDYHVSALAEWTWNANGRDLAQFARAWATRAGFPNPAKFAEWIVLVDPIQKPMHTVLMSREWAKVPERISAGDTPRLGKDLFQGFVFPDKLDAQRAACTAAAMVAHECGREEIVLETAYIGAMLGALAALDDLLPGESVADPARRDQALADVRAAVQGMIEAFDAKTALIAAEPQAFADTIKTGHAQRWNEFLGKIESALAEAKPGTNKNRP